MLLRSRRHRRGELAACGCHKRWYRVEVAPARFSFVHAFCDPVWRIRARRRVTTLPDISTYEEGAK